MIGQFVGSSPRLPPVAAQPGPEVDVVDGVEPVDEQAVAQDAAGDRQHQEDGLAPEAHVRTLERLRPEQVEPLAEVR
jgi:hypothetical protein